jgi:hypothetical protein
MLHTYHLMFDHLLRRVEETKLIGNLASLNAAMVKQATAYQRQAAGTSWENAANRTAGLFEVGSKLLDPKFVLPATAPKEVSAELDLIGKHDAIHESPLINIGLGVGFRNTDTGRESALERLVAKEFQTPTEFVFVGDVYPENTGRGWYECKIFLAFPQGVPANGQWFPVDALPENIVSGHRDVIIPFALEKFKEYTGRCFGWSADKEESL